MEAEVVTGLKTVFSELMKKAILGSERYPVRSNVGVPRYLEVDFVLMG